MTRELDGPAHWHEPKHGERAGFGRFGQPQSDYDKFMEADGIPVFRGIGIRTVRDLELADWPRMGGRGSYIQLHGTEGKWGQYVVEVPGGGALNAEKHLYEEIFLVAEGRGTTEVWLEEDGQRHVFEWEKGSLFSIPVNAYHRIVNATGEPALLIGGTTAPNLMNLIGDDELIFNCPYKMTSRFSGSKDFYKYKEDLEPDPIRGLAMRRTNLVPDVIGCDLPLDNRRSPGWRRGRAVHDGQQVLPLARPARDGQVFQGPRPHLGRRADLHQGQGLHLYLARAGGRDALEGRQGRPGGARRLRAVRHGHRPRRAASAGITQHFNSSSEPFRLTAWFGPNHPTIVTGLPPGAKQIDYTAMDVTEGGTSIPYWMEDPKLRAEFEALIEKNGGRSRMDPTLYERPANP